MQLVFIFIFLLYFYFLVIEKLLQLCIEHHRKPICCGITSFAKAHFYHKPAIRKEKLQLSAFFKGQQRKVSVTIELAVSNYKPVLYSTELHLQNLAYAVADNIFPVHKILKISRCIMLNMAPVYRLSFFQLMK